MKYHITVTQDDLDQCRQHIYDGNSCPIARAIKRSVLAASVEQLWVYSDGTVELGGGVYGQLSKRATRFINYFDWKDKTGEPSTFILTVEEY